MRKFSMPRLNLGHFIIVFIVIVPNVISAIMFKSWIPSLGVAVWLIFPCKDRKFGNGRKYFWMRQTVFSIGTVAVLLIGLYNTPKAIKYP